MQQGNLIKDKREMTTKIKIGIVGSRGYTDKKKVKDLIFKNKVFNNWRQESSMDV